MPKFLGQLVKFYPIGLLLCLVATVYLDFWVFILLMMSGGEVFFVNGLSCMALAGTVGLLLGLIKQGSTNRIFVVLPLFSCLLLPALAVWIRLKSSFSTVTIQHTLTLGERLFFVAFVLQLPLFIPKLLRQKFLE